MIKNNQWNDDFNNVKFNMVYANTMSHSQEQKMNNIKFGNNAIFDGILPLVILRRTWVEIKNAQGCCGHFNTFYESLGKIIRRQLRERKCTPLNKHCLSDC